MEIFIGMKMFVVLASSALATGVIVSIIAIAFELNEISKQLRKMNVLKCIELEIPEEGGF